MRSRLPREAARLRPVEAPSGTVVTAPRSCVVYLAPEVALGPDGNAWREALAAWDRPLVLCVGAAAPQPVGGSEARRRIGLLAIEQAAWTIADRDPRFSVAASRTEIDWALKHRHRSIWAPSHMVTAAVHATPDAGDPVALAAWLANDIGAELLVIVGAEAPRADGRKFGVRSLERPEDLTALE